MTNQPLGSWVSSGSFISKTDNKEEQDRVSFNQNLYCKFANIPRELAITVKNTVTQNIEVYAFTGAVNIDLLDSIKTDDVIDFVSSIYGVNKPDIVAAEYDGELLGNCILISVNTVVLKDEKL